MGWGIFSGEMGCAKGEEERLRLRGWMEIELGEEVGGWFGGRSGLGAWSWY